MDHLEANNSAELESFREQWRREVQQRCSQSSPSSAQPSASSSAPARAPRKPPRTQKAAACDDHDDHDDHGQQPRVFAHPPGDAHTTKEQKTPQTSADDRKQPVSALEHYEQAVEKEAAGSLGDSLRLYRKAFRMDDAVDQQYRNKHFPRSLAPRPAGAAHAAPVSTGSDGVNDGLKGVIASFAGLHMEPAPPPVEGAPAPPCPLAALPEEILVHILRDVAVLDVAAFVRLAQVCRKLAYLVATEHRIWRRVCLGPEFGFGGMHYHFATRLTWEPLAGEHLARHARQSEAATRALLGRAYGASWQCMFRQRPRVRFNGCYIATVNYIRQGLAGAHQVTWDSPVHIVTYYRYLRFFRDGTCVSLLTTAEPADVVHQLTREAVTMHAGGGKAGAHLPSYVVAQALRGRWRLADPAGLVLGDGKGDGDCVAPEATAGSAVAGASAGAGAGEVEGDLFVETEGVGKYMYRMDLSLRNAGKGTRNNKLVWRAFYSYNRLTDDWAEFGLRNDKPFFFSRVKSYGMGE